MAWLDVAVLGGVLVILIVMLRIYLKYAKVDGKGQPASSPRPASC